MVEADRDQMILEGAPPSQEAALLRTVELAPCALVTADRDGVITRVNAAAERLFARARRDLLGTKLERILPGLSRLADAGEFEPAVVLKAGGAMLDVDAALTRSPDADGERLLALVPDRRAGDAERAVREKDALLAELHHRVKNNLQMIDSLLDLQIGRVVDGSIRSVLRDSRNRIRAMALIHQCLYESQNFAEVNFAQFLDRIAPALIVSYGVDTSRVRLEIDSETVLLPVKVGVPAGLIVNELLSNALRHGLPGGRAGEVAVTLKGVPEGAIELGVSDDGIGLPEPIDPTAPDTLGLQLVQVLTDQLHGRLDVKRSNPTRFVLTFPQQH